jgi:hypothetical protein
MDIKNIIIGSVAVLALLVSVGGAYLKSDTTPTEHPAGALTGPVVPYNYLTIGGATIYDQSVSLTQGASTTCAIQNGPATSTLQAAQIRFDVASSGAAVLVDVGVANDRFSTTTKIGSSYTIAQGAQAFIQASTSPAAGASTVIGPNQWVNWKIGSGGSASVPSGTCQAEFVSS